MVRMECNRRDILQEKNITGGYARMKHDVKEGPDGKRGKSRACGRSDTRKMKNGFMTKSLLILQTTFLRICLTFPPSRSTFMWKSHRDDDDHIRKQMIIPDLMDLITIMKSSDADIHTEEF